MTYIIIHLLFNLIYIAFEHVHSYTINVNIICNKMHEYYYYNKLILMGSHVHNNIPKSPV